MTQFSGRATQYLGFGSVRLFPPPRGSDCGINERFCQPTEQGDNITFQFLAAETANLITDGTFPDGSHDSICGVKSWCGSGWSVINNATTHQVGSINVLRQQSIFTINNFFRITFTVSVQVAGTVIVANEGATIDRIATIDRAGTYTFFYIATLTGDLIFQPNVDFNGVLKDVEVIQIAQESDYDIDIFDVETGLKIDDVPVGAVTGSTSNNVITVDFNWTDDVTVTNGCREIRIFLTGSTAGDPGNIFEDDFTDNRLGWLFLGALSVVGGRLFFDFDFDFVNSGTFRNVFEVGKNYTISFDIVNFVCGTVTVKFGDAVAGTFSGNSSITVTNIATGNGDLTFVFKDVADCGELGIDNVIISKANDFDALSECFDLQTSHDCSLLWIWSNDNNWGSYDYSVIVGGGLFNFQHKLRLISKFRGVKYPKESNIGEDSAGVKSVDYFSLRKTKLLDIFRMPDYLHDAVAAFWAHDTRTINGTSFIMEDEYEPSAPNDSVLLSKDLMDATIEIQETTQANLINRNE